MQRHELRVPRDLFESLQALALATGEDVRVHLARALHAYLTDEGHRAAVDGFTDRARERHRIALDRLDAP
jgi:DNA-binding transcriptional MocR family regulator